MCIKYGSCTSLFNRLQSATCDLDDSCPLDVPEEEHGMEDVGLLMLDEYDAIGEDEEVNIM